ncbi:hypothetical protein A2715_00615 [Candidatus Woesebacteria bacterium RIFCSPHIGHO2_01_FULL_39_32]|uniref:YdbS-like PH domain-containing protein n=1 Tax=Candidatus Woesebacteria bacterium RIFCSPLOWO2_01_FULL_39_25 TaxID=1802521 RepID=A0A1F8BI37_9BACT|nr:MAG: hypothetical protein A2124_03415 [Candidatus Woesebacteria bacterium GWB1_37_5]OGM24417.1 MAG: hypothetical protein A2715_00615 [Candidatus Woesebacteria bacterium RIFCSPHIGHO2_01_FULL_39_32]OGM35575.1 MAG: hypothetical protein A3F01_02655 [Candidatus Woesebacteria bacterium RIFCSPHIGHO2_12_FULL_38_11]OGM63724.1 MAG: hypothetical protein A2893_01955 [Candidatus Woesebacteria bacterium RIFCSPLOWO2_01_FULL_39_25]
MKAFSIFTKSRYSFEGKFPDEKTIKVIRMHWFALVRQGLVALVSAIPIIITIFASGYSPEVEIQKFMLFLSGLLFLYWWFWVFYIAMMYYLNIWIITDHRLIESEQLGFFRRNYTELNISKIQDVSVDVEGMFETFLNIGNLEVQSAAAEKKFKMINIPEPLEVKETIMKANNDYLRTHPQGVEENVNI